jgi:tetratricopeptide (TPR) repeat protein
MALALENLGTASPWLGRYEAGMEYQERSLALRRELGDKPGIAVSARYLSRLVLRAGDCGTARGLSEEGLAIERELGKPAEEAESLGFLAQVSMVERNYDEARSLLDQSLVLHRRRIDVPVPGWILHAVGDVATRQRDFAAARSALSELVDIARRLQQPAVLAGGLSRLCLVALAEGNLDELRQCAVEVLADDTSRTVVWVQALLSEALAGASIRWGDTAVAARLLGASDGLRRTFDPPAQEPYLGAEHGSAVDGARRELGDGAFTALWEEGAALGREELADLLDQAAAGLSPPALPSS